MKSQKELEGLPEDSLDIFQTNILDKYAARPDTLKNMCYADFAACYFTSTKDGDETEVKDTDTERKTREVIKLKRNLGNMYKRLTPQFIRFHSIPRRSDPEGYFHRLLILYLPWQEEASLKSMGTYEDTFNSVKEDIKAKIEEYEGRLEEIQSVELTENDSPLHAWDLLSANAEQEKSDEAAHDPDPEDTETPEFPITDAQATPVYTVEFSNDMIPPTDYYNMVRTLNTRLRHAFDYVVDWCWKFKNGQKTGETVNPFHLSGGGGVGKSHTLMAIYHGILHTLRDVGQDPTDVCAILTAPTGTAAFNIGGMTIHSALCLPVKEKRMKQQPDYMQLSNDKKNTLKVKLQHLRVVIIDEVSMVGAQTLISIHKRLQEIKDNKSDVPFGGVSILAVGDLLQLPPVGDSAVFSTPRDPMHRMSMSLWETHFLLEELTEVQRQRGDPTFADILNRVRVGSHTDDDMATLATRVKDTDVDCLHIYPTNAQVDKHNQDKLEALGDSCIHICSG